MILEGPYFPSHDENKMKNEGDVEAARRFYYEKQPKNLRFLLHQRFDWMNSYCEGKESIIEVGSGSAFSREFIRNSSFKTSDYIKKPWIDLQIDALNTELATESIDIVISSHMIHHLANPLVFFREMSRILKPGGLLLIQEIETGLLMRILLRVMRHEGWSFKANVYDENEICNDPRDPWSANCAIPQLLFSQPSEFENKTNFKIIQNELCESLIFPLSGGVIAKVNMLPLPWVVLEWINKLDQFLVWLLPSVFAMGRRVVLEKKGGVP